MNMDKQASIKLELRSQYESRLDAALVELDEAARAIATSEGFGAVYHDLVRAILGALASKASIRNGLYNAAQRAQRPRDGGRRL
jgi:hypothetical protein